MPSPVSPVLAFDADVGTSRLCARRDEIENYLVAEFPAKQDHVF